MNKEQPRASTERLLAWTALFYGLTIFNPWTEVFPYSQMTTAMSSELIIGLILMSMGILQIIAIQKNTLFIRKWSALSGATLWGYLAWLYFLGHLELGVFTALTSPGVLVFLLWGWVLAYRGYRLR